MKDTVLRSLAFLAVSACLVVLSAGLSHAQDYGRMTIGEAHYVGHCAACHGRTGAGDGPLAQGMTPPPTNFRTATPATLPDNTIEQAILAGKGPMRSFATIFRSEDIREIVSYMRSLAVTP